MDFKYTTISLNDTYRMGFGHALEMIKRNGGSVGEDEVKIEVKEPQAVKFEVAFEGHYPIENQMIRWGENQLKHGGSTEYAIKFEGKGFVIRGGARKLSGTTEDKDLRIEVYVDDMLHEEAVLPTSQQARRHDLTWKYSLDDGPHTARRRPPRRWPSRRCSPH